jgi:hypothetical protein
MVTHEVWLEGSAAPLIVDLEDDRLFQDFLRWVQKDPQFTASGWVGTIEERTWVINFQRVTCIAISSKKNRGAMGFGR